MDDDAAKARMTFAHMFPSRIQVAVNGVLTLELDTVIQELHDRLGSKLTALINRAMVSRSKSAPSSAPLDEMAFRAALQATRAIAERYDNDAARVWFRSTNPGFAMRAPIVALADARTLRDYDLFVRCAVQDVS
jgi:hypothetical protein